MTFSPMFGVRTTRSLILIGVAALVAACSGGEPSGDVTAVPEPWRSETAEGWPSSDAFGKSMPILSRSSCLLGEAPDPLEAGPESTTVGWGPFGPDSKNPESYLYMCGFWERDRYAGDVRLYQAPDAATLDALVADFANRPSRGNDLSRGEVTSRAVEVHVLRTWIPSNPQGAVEALYVDPATLSAVILEVNSLSEEDFAAYTNERAADDLTGLIVAVE